MRSRRRSCAPGTASTSSTPPGSSGRGFSRSSSTRLATAAGATAAANGSSSASPKDAGARRSQPAPEGEVASRERLEIVLAEIEKMDETDQQILAYRYFLDLPTVEISQIVEMPHGTVRSRISRARQRLRERIGAIDAGEPVTSNREHASDE